MNKYDLRFLNMWNGLIDSINCYAPAKYTISFVDPEDQSVVNGDSDGLCEVKVTVDNSIDLDMALDRCWRLGKVVEAMLNQYYASDNTKEWFMYNEPSFQKHNRKECNDEWVIKNGGEVLYQIFKDRR